VTVGLQRAHAQFLGQGLLVVGSGLVDVRRLATPGDLAEEPTGMRLVARPGVGVGEFEESSGSKALRRSSRRSMACASVSWRSGRWASAASACSKYATASRYAERAVARPPACRQ
jgi:hypothetical protein